MHMSQPSNFISVLGTRYKIWIRNKLEWIRPVLESIKNDDMVIAS